MLDRFRPREEWFRHAPRGIHGIAHAARVLVWAERLMDALVDEGVEVNRDVVRCAAVVHDVGRVEDGRDLEHGRRSAVWVAENVTRLPVALTEGQLAAVGYCCEWHVPPDGACPGMTDELRVLKDADGLDRVRIHDLDPAQLRREAARRLVPQAWELLERSEHAVGRSDDPWERVRAAALDMGLWR